MNKKVYVVVESFDDGKDEKRYKYGQESIYCNRSMG